MLAAERFVQTIAMFMKHDLARRAPVILLAKKGSADSSSKAQTSSQSAVRRENSIKAVHNRKAKYGESKLKRDTRDVMKKQKGFNLEKENR